MATKRKAGEVEVVQLPPEDNDWQMGLVFFMALGALLWCATFTFCGPNHAEIYKKNLTCNYGQVANIRDGELLCVDVEGPTYCKKCGVAFKPTAMGGFKQCCCGGADIGFWAYYSEEYCPAHRTEAHCK